MAAAKSLQHSSATKLALLLLVCIAIVAPAAAAAQTAAAPTDPYLTEKFSFFRCISFVSEATKCVVDVVKKAVAPHPSCCKAISRLGDCSSSFLKDIPSDEMGLIKTVCALWGVSIP